jgi:hypothetical protein
MSKIKHHLTRALTLPPHILIQKTARKAKGYITKHYQRQHDKRHSTYSEILIDDALHHYFSTVDVEQLRSMSEMFSGITSHYLEHRFDLLGSGWVQVKHGMYCRGLEGYRYEIRKNPTPTVNAANLAESKRILALIDNNYTLIDWQLDFKSGYRWSEATWYQDIRYGHQLGVDVKVPWELARMQHLPQLAFQYALTDKKPIYPREFRHQVLDFMAMNPPRFGVNWRCTMDVGIRVANWLVAYDLFCAYGAEFDEAFLKLFKRSVYEHGRHIINNLEWAPDLRSNHYLSDIVGLLYVAAYLPTTSEVEVWLAFAVEELIKEVKTQFHPDGSNFEASTSYHRLSGELVIYATLLILALPNSPKKIPDWYITRLQKIAEFTMAITRPDGLIPQIGDNDSGRFLKLFPVYKKLRLAEAKARYLNLRNYNEPLTEYWLEEILDHRHLVAAINTLFEHQAFTQFAGTASIESNSLKPKQSFNVIEKPENHFPDFGLYIYKTERIYLIVRCGSVGQHGNGGHDHNDQLSVELCVDGIPFIVDPGTYIYTPLPKQRNAFRATASHNTLIAPGKEQNKLEETQLFSLSEKAYAKVTKQSEYQIQMEHRGFGKVHQREIEIAPSSEKVLMRDHYEGTESVTMNFTLAPGVNAEIDGQNVLLSRGGTKVRLEADGGKWRSEDGLFSGGYGLLEQTNRVICCYDNIGTIIGINISTTKRSGGTPTRISE